MHKENQFNEPQNTVNQSILICREDESHLKVREMFFIPFIFVWWKKVEQKSLRQPQ